MVSRAARGAFASALVFPGGAIDSDDREDGWREHVDDFDDFAEDERALRIGAIREVWEETGLLLGGPSGPARSGEPFREALEQTSSRIRLDALTHFGHWITPASEPRRFDTHFFLAAVERDAVAIPDGVETLDTEWLPPARAAELAKSGERPIIFPTMLNLLRVAESENTADAISAARARPRVTVAPVWETRDDGTRWVSIPVEAGYPVLEWRDTR